LTESFPGLSLRKACRLLKVARSSMEERETKRKEPELDELLVKRIEKVILQFPTFGYRRIWAWLRYREGVKVNQKAVYRVLKVKGWFVHQRVSTPRPRVKGRRSVTTTSDTRWAMDVTHIPVGRDGWAHLAAVIDCADREIVGYELALRGRSQEAERALEDACLRRFGHVRRGGSRPLLRSDNGLIFQSHRFRKACREYGIKQEYITPYTPEQNGVIERFFRSLKEECVWLTNFKSFKEAQRAIERWIRWYNEERPHQALGYLSPVEYRSEKVNLVA